MARARAAERGGVGVGHVDEVGADQRAAPGQVQVVLDDHDGPGGEIGPDAAGGGGEDDGPAAGGDAGPQRDGRPPRQSGPRRDGSGPPRTRIRRPPCVDRPGRGPDARPPYRAGRRAACRAGPTPRPPPGPRPCPRARCRAPPGRRGGRSPDGGPVPGRCAPPGRRQPPWGDRRGSSRLAARNISRTCPPRPPPPPSTRSLPLTGDEIIAAREIVFASGRADIPNEALRFAYIGLCDPPKEMVRARRCRRGCGDRPATAHRPAAGPGSRRGRSDRLGHPG